MDEKNKKETLLFFNEAIEYFDKFNSQDTILSTRANHDNFNANFLRNSMLNELNNLKNIIENNPDLKIEALSEAERENFYKFLNFYRICPICGNLNHYFNLKQLFFNEHKKLLIKNLIEFMDVKNKKFRNYNLNFGIPCCNCHRNLTQE
ncbi:MAG: hypothetical protein ACXABO_09130 [Promethearchaeota archaeon]|jgi:UDP:flavonoid glycosyltransferase YjiC (YdhE family)